MALTRGPKASGASSASGSMSCSAEDSCATRYLASAHQGLQLVVLEVAVEGGLGDLGLLLLVTDPREQADLLQGQLARPQRLQDVGVDASQSLQPLDVELGVAESRGDGLGRHLG